LRAVLAGILGRNAVPAEGDFALRDAGLDSVAMIELLTALESELGVRLGPAEIRPEHFETLGSLESFVATKSGDAK